MTFQLSRPDIDTIISYYGYDKGQAVYKAALAAGVKPEITLY